VNKIRKKWGAGLPWGGRFVSAVVLGSRGAEWSVWRVRAGHREPVASGEREWPSGDGDAAPETPDPMRSALAGDVIVALPAAEAILRVAELPATDPAELQGMVELQADRFSPFPLDQVSLSCETLGVHDGVTRVVIAAVRRDTIEQACAKTLGAGRRATRVDLDLTAWWSAVRPRAESSSEGRVLHLRPAGPVLWLVATQDAEPILMRCLPGGVEDQAGPAEWMEELAFTLASLEQEWGARAVRLALWDWPEGGAAARDALSKMHGFEQISAMESGLSALSPAVAERHAPGAGPATPLNLAPAEWLQARRDRARRHRVIAGLAGLAALWALIAGGFLIALAVRAAAVERIRARVRAAEAPAEQVRQLQQRVRALEAHGDRTTSALELLRLVSEKLPPDGKITSFSYRKGRALHLRAEVSAADQAYDYVTALENSKLFREIRPEGVVQKKTIAGAVTEFRVNGEFPEDKP
jgi:hypothetical protein